MKTQPEAKSVYMDVGCWQSKEKAKPLMTFGVLVHNGLALCNFFSDGKNRFDVSSSNKYNFSNSLINDFLKFLMQKKYRRFFTNDEVAKGYHIIKFIPFPDKALICHTNKIIIFIPDLHLHYFKESYLDNFITYFENSTFEGGRPTYKPCKRRSMEYEFSIFINALIDYQKNKNKILEVIFMGDSTELWEANAILYYHKYFQKERFLLTIPDLYYQYKYDFLMSILKAMKKYLTKSNMDKKNIYLKYIEKLLKGDKWKLAYDEKVIEKISAVLFQKEMDSILINRGDKGNVLKLKAQNMDIEILRQYKYSGNLTLNDLFYGSEVRAPGGELNFYRASGNHDNFLSIDSNESNFSISTGEYFIIPSEHFPYINNESSMIFVEHGHMLDGSPVNSDEASGIGFAVTNLLTFFEVKNLGDLLKNFEGEHKDVNWRDGFDLNIFNVFNYWEKKVETKNSLNTKNMIMIYAHTHEPKLEESTKSYKLYKKRSKLFETQRKEKSSKEILQIMGLGGPKKAKFTNIIACDLVEMLMGPPYSR